jgi:hypothetical protein
MNKRSSNTISGVTAALLMASHILCIIAFVHSWMQVQSIRTPKDFWNFIRRKHHKETHPEIEIAELSTTKQDKKYPYLL